MFRFEILAEQGAARRGRIHTDHGVLETPGFLAVATRAALKGLDAASARRVGIQALICNTYHLELMPGTAAVAERGGLHRFMGWDGVAATDSGGFQVFSLRHGQVADEIKGRRRLPALAEEPLDAVRLDEQGADFRSYIDGSRRRFTPESAVDMQRLLGADVLFCLDECTPLHVPREYTADATDRNLRWARRCLERYQQLEMASTQALFGIVHGGVYQELRRRSAEGMAAMPFPGFGIGDCLGESKQDWYRVVDMVVPLLPRDRPRHLLGVGEPDDLIEGALRGIDSFDCAMPTRIARHGHALAFGRPRFRLDLTAAERAGEDGPIEEGCPCTACRQVGRAYLRHLHRAGEMLGISLTVEHNLSFTARLMERIREAISAGALEELRREALGISPA